MDYEGTTPVSTGDTVLRYDWIKKLWHECTVVDALASQMTVEWERAVSGDRESPLCFDFLIYTDKGTTWKLNS